MSTSIPAETARHVLWTFGHRGGIQPGTYHQKLLDLLAYAPPVELAKFAQVFPAEAEAVRMAKYDEDGVKRLKNAAGLTCIRCGDEDGPFVGAPRQPLCEPCARPMPLDGVA
ncbi:hypothetical protein ABZ636_03685 [Streptomyces sp. NPDC007251]|uniref:hypothetical protein n=1 Tax=Streptomyces sp. NPDC007251 TaxID=3154483 RepID=UPI0033CE1064